MKYAINCILSLAIVFILATPVLAQNKPSLLNHIVSVVNDDVVLNSELLDKLSAIKRQLKVQGTSLPSDTVLKKQVLERIIVDRLQMQQAKTQGIKVSDEGLNQAIQNIADQNKMTLNAMKLSVEQDGLNFAEYREDIRRELMLVRLQQKRVGDRISVTNQEVDNFLSTQTIQGNAEDEYKLAHILIALPETASPEEIQKIQQNATKVLDRLKKGADFSQTALEVSQGQQALQGGDLGWRKGGELPTPFIAAITKIKIGEMSELVRSQNGFHIIKLMDKKGGTKHMITKFHARHILIKPNDIVSVKEVVQRLTRLKTRMEGGQEFAKLALANSEDKASANNGGDLGWLNPGDMVPEFAQTLKTLKNNQISEPFESRFGWHIVQLVDKRDHDNTDEFKRTQAREFIYQRKFSEELQTWLRQLRDEAFVEIRLDQTQAGIQK